MRAGALSSFLAIVAGGGCIFNDSAADSCSGQARYLCVSGCGSDSIQSEVCRDGSWTCPDNLMRGDLDCPPGTCFNNPNYNTCCNSSGEKTKKICQSQPGSLPYAGVCPAGYSECSPYPQADAGGDVGVEAAPLKDAGELVSE